MDDSQDVLQRYLARAQVLREQADEELSATQLRDIALELGMSPEDLDRLDEALGAFRHSQAINPRHLASHERPRAADRIVEVEKEKARLEVLERTLGPLESVPGSAAYHSLRARQLELRGEPTAARAHRLQAISARQTIGENEPGD